MKLFLQIFATKIGWLGLTLLLATLYTYNSSSLSLTELGSSGTYNYDVNGNVFFNFEYTLSSGETYTPGVDFIVVGFRVNSMHSSYYNWALDQS